MAVNKLTNGNYQARLQGVDGRILSKVFTTKAEAENQHMKWKLQKRDGSLSSNYARKMTVNEFFEQWFSDVLGERRQEDQTGWRKEQFRLYRDYVSPVIGNCRLGSVTPHLVNSALNEMSRLGKSEQTRMHVFNLVRKLFNDAIEKYQFVTFNPAIRKLKPKVPVREARHLNIEQIKMLLSHVENEKYGLAIWIQLYLGLRFGELAAIRWEDLDLSTGRAVIRRTYVRKMEQFRDYPKGRKQHIVSTPTELLEKLKAAQVNATGDLVVTSPNGNVLPYRWYLKALGTYCRSLGIPMLSTHGLRHSTSELYLSNGASRDDLRQLFAHSSLQITDRYVHQRGTNLERVSNVIRLFPESTKNRPKVETAEQA